MLYNCMSPSSPNYLHKHSICVCGDLQRRLRFGIDQYDAVNCVTESRCMQITISTRHGHLGPSSKDKITAKAEKLLRFNDRLVAIEVTVDLEHTESPSV